MIRNIVFDMVGVVMTFDRDGYYRQNGVSEEDQSLLEREVFRSLEFAMGDRGTISEEDAVASICTRVPRRLHGVVADLIYRRHDILPVPGMQALLSDLKARGLALYLLSNISEAFHRFHADIPGIELFDDVLVSCDAHLVKPDPAIFRKAYRQFGIDPAESAFIDDSSFNAEAAQHTGMRAFVFHGDVGAARRWLESLSAAS